MVERKNRLSLRSEVDGTSQRWKETLICWEKKSGGYWIPNTKIRREILKK